MSDGTDILAIYLHLAEASRLRRRPHVRDKLLVIAAANAWRLDLPQVANYCRLMILQHNPQHMVRRWPTIAEAMEDSDFLFFLKQLQRRYPQEKAERMMLELGIETGCERATYYSAEEYAASLLGTNPDAMARLLAEEQP